MLRIISLLVNRHDAVVRRRLHFIHAADVISGNSANEFGFLPSLEPLPSEERGHRAICRSTSKQCLGIVKRSRRVPFSLTGEGLGMRTLKPLRVSDSIVSGSGVTAL